VVLFSFSLGSAELLNLDVDRIALPRGCVLFVYLIALRFWSAREPLEVSPSNSIAGTELNTL